MPVPNVIILGAQRQKTDGMKNPVSFDFKGVFSARSILLREIEAIQIHHLIPGGDKVVHELFLVVILGVDFGQRA